jgi:hypothetical protein
MRYSKLVYILFVCSSLSLYGSLERIQEAPLLEFLGDSLGLSQTELDMIDGRLDELRKSLQDLRDSGRSSGVSSPTSILDLQKEIDRVEARRRKAESDLIVLEQQVAQEEEKHRQEKVQACAAKFNRYLPPRRQRIIIAPQKQKVAPRSFASLGLAQRKKEAAKDGFVDCGSPTEDGDGDWFEKLMGE